MQHATLTLTTLTIATAFLLQPTAQGKPKQAHTPGETIASEYDRFFATPFERNIFYAVKFAKPGMSQVRRQKMLFNHLASVLSECLPNDLLAIERAARNGSRDGYYDIDGDGTVSNGDIDALNDVVQTHVHAIAPLYLAQFQQYAQTHGSTAAAIEAAAQLETWQRGRDEVCLTSFCDQDGDGIDDLDDNCPVDANPGQQNADRDPMGDPCDTDDDNDAIQDSIDNCEVGGTAPASCVDLGCTMLYDRLLAQQDAIENPGIKNALLAQASHACTLTMAGDHPAARGAYRSLRREMPRLLSRRSRSSTGPVLL